jgi:hypothetical protein
MLISYVVLTTWTSTANDVGNKHTQNPKFQKRHSINCVTHCELYKLSFASSSVSIPHRKSYVPNQRRPACVGTLTYCLRSEHVFSRLRTCFHMQSCGIEAHKALTSPAIKPPVHTSPSEIAANRRNSGSDGFRCSSSASRCRHLRTATISC